MEDFTSSALAIYDSSAKALYESAKSCIFSYWASLVKKEVKCRECTNYSKAWLDNFSNWISIANNYVIPGDPPKKLSNYYSKNVRAFSAAMGYELGVLLPDEDKIKAFLPVLLIGYCHKRKAGMDKEKVPVGTANFVENLLYGFENGKIPESEFILKEHLFSPSNVFKRYPKLQPNHFSFIFCKRAPFIFSDIVLFLNFLIQTKSICNVTLSFYIYESLSAMLSLLGGEAITFINKIENSQSSANIKDDFLKDEIISFAEEFLKDYTTSACKENYGTPFSFALFLATLKYRLSQVDRPGRDTKDTDTSNFILGASTSSKHGIVDEYLFLTTVKRLPPKKRYRIKASL